MAAAGVSPSSSPRLPSPPPFTEVQIGPQSPSVGESFSGDADQLLGVSPGADDGPTRRIRPGTRAAEMSAGPPLIPLSQLDSPFQLQEHLKALYNHYTRPEGSDLIVPIQQEVARQIAEPPEGVDRALWLYELCRFLTMKVNNLIIAFFAENPPCSSTTCPEMRASEWQYLCAVHDPPKSCCAIDYCCHTLDWATNILTSPKHFPSRLTLGSESGGGPQAGLRHLTNIFRRLYRIFAHAWFQHREVFWQVEGHDGLYIFFKTVCDRYHLIPEDNYTVPPEAEGEDMLRPAPVQQDQLDGRRLTILRKDNEPLLPALENVEPASISTGATTRRHKSTPSISSRAVTTISESAEDSEEPSPPLPSLEPKEVEPEPPVVEETSETEKQEKLEQEDNEEKKDEEKQDEEEEEKQEEEEEEKQDEEKEEQEEKEEHDSTTISAAIEQPVNDNGAKVTVEEVQDDETPSNSTENEEPTPTEQEEPGKPTQTTSTTMTETTEDEKNATATAEDLNPETKLEAKPEAGDEPTKEG